MTTLHVLVYAIGIQLALLGGVLVYSASRMRHEATQKRLGAMLADAEQVEAIAAPSPVATLLERVGRLGLSARSVTALGWMYRTRGWDERRQLITFGVTRIGICLALGAAGGAVGVLAAQINPQLGPVRVLGPLLGAAMGWAFVALQVRGAAGGRAAEVSNNMTDALELMLICIGSGQALEQALARVAAEVRPRQPGLADELERTIADLQVLGDQEAAFRKLGERVPTKAIGSIVAILCQSLQYGSPLTAALREVIDFARKTELLTLEERASKFPSLVTLPTLLFIFPSLLALLVAPAAINLIQSLETL